jgi:hypothetical protein
MVKFLLISSQDSLASTAIIMLYVLIILIMYGNIILYFQLYLQVSLLYNKMLIFSLSSEQLSMCGYFLYYNYMN